MNLTIDIARRILEASKQRAIELRSPVSIAIVDAGGHLVLFERMMSPYGWATGNISIAKASTAVMFNQSTDAVAQWGSGIPGFASSMASMSQGKFIMAAGGWPIRLGGATIGGIGISGGNAPGRDDDIARAGLAALEAMAPPVPAMQPMQQSQSIGQAQPRPPLQPTPSYPSMPSPASSLYNAPVNPSLASQNVPNSTHHLDLDQDGSYSSEDQQLPPDQYYNESRGGQS
ncbi:MAG TPA: heme-binding protein [Ktedonobacteraceae bacterium]|jgi:uncharacterized protein GlcG (DUF336 family)|nr:heme-binding protein [Ktedonobacteraceae bacterium]